ncbi:MULTISPECIES: IS110 family transposase [Bacillus cereus group]|uniref:IS110 family transposase n=1 Tax=Bacillus thuringiensis subsp. jegathesan TaxID=56955 RepID=A0A9X6M3A1_BACTJ|nr:MULTISPECIES: IS110 family transposase [Bacillus cereus group]MDA1681090.1 IS110 family transposase [Bacillus cereus group sp. TH152-1LC]OUB57883.1 IS110 family transposase [Bacillus thuringiensis serovar jegathesan]PEV01253.1 IS110 family transposase [Bacillus cereus]PGM66678.1 IS110 family transposase [Bacillus cereus]HDR8453062.1 IS110 family transposase [Bacillus cereus]
MISVGIDVAKEKSVVAIMNEERKLLKKVVTLNHTMSEISAFIELLSFYQEDEEVRIIMEATGYYHEPVLQLLCESGFKVYVVNALVIKKYNDAKLRQVKTDKQDAIKLAEYLLGNHYQLREHKEEGSKYQELRFYAREYHKSMAIKVKIKNQLTQLIDKCFPGIKKIYHNNMEGTLLDVLEKYPTIDHVSRLGQKRFSNLFIKWATKKGHRIAEKKAVQIYELTLKGVQTVPSSECAEMMMRLLIKSLREQIEITTSILTQMKTIAESIPEYGVVREMSGVGDRTGPRLLAEIGDIRRFRSSRALVAYAGIDVSPYQSGQFEARERKITKRGSKYLRKVLYEIVQSLKTVKPTRDSAVYQYVLRKELEGKASKKAKVAGMNKFLRIYYARVMEVYQL